MSKKSQLNGARRRAKNKNVKFFISVRDIPETPKICPVLGIEIKPGTLTFSDNSPSLDRIFPELGYVRGNLRIISYRANTLKNNGTIDEFKLIIKDLEEINKKELEIKNLVKLLNR
jgi:hypothetical protein